MLLVDTHVHIYGCFNLPIFLDSVFANFQAKATRCGRENAFVGILLLAETATEKWFERLAEMAASKQGIWGDNSGHWSFHFTDEKCSLLARRGDNRSLLLIAGRQVSTSDGLEVLALATDKDFEDGDSLEMTLEGVRNSDAIPVLPWGFGKWMGKRGAILKDLILQAIQDSDFFLGDNSGRPGFLPTPVHFELAARKGFRILPGSDPLPLASETRRAGSFGLSMDENISPDYPARDLKHALLDTKAPFHQYGKLEHPLRFFRNQLRIRLLRGCFFR